MNGIFGGTLEELRKSLESIDPSEFGCLVDDCVSALGRGGKVVVTGLGKNVPICEKFVGTMWSLGLNAAFVHTNTAVHGDLGVIRDSDVVIMLTKSGETCESIYLLEYIKKKRALDWALTFKRGSTVERMATRSLVVELESEGDPWNIIPNNSTTINLIVLQNLAISICYIMGITLDMFKENHPGGHIGVQLRDA
ncbi:MAG: SIS domain-containing protein [Gudongella sp.]|nr:SIS domain-containing protein [Gudongella sp.]